MLDQPPEPRLHRTDAQRINDCVGYALRGAERIRTASAALLIALRAYPRHADVEPIRGHELVDVIGAVEEWTAGIDLDRVANRTDEAMADRLEDLAV